MKTLTFDTAYKQLEELVAQLEADDEQLDAMADKVKQAKALIKFCEEKLRGIERELADDNDENAD
jgi:exodeoxyribonuclease VII small subunit